MFFLIFYNRKKSNVYLMEVFVCMVRELIFKIICYDLLYFIKNNWREFVCIV